MTEQDQINLLEKAWNQGWMHRERYDEIEHPKGMDYEEINFYHFEKWLAKNKQLIIHSVVVQKGTLLYDPKCDDGCKYYCTKGGTQYPECLK